MGPSRRTYSPEFKIEAVKQVVEQGRPAQEVADGLGIPAKMLRRWKAELTEAGTVAFPGRGKVKASDEEVRELRRRLAIAEQERDILKKAVAYFAKDKN